MRERLPAWVVPLLIGLATVTAGLFTWRAGQLGSTAAFEDRQSVGQTIQQQQQDVEAGLAAITDAVAYVGYVADYAEAEALDDQAEEVGDQGAVALADAFLRQADDLRSSASALAAASGVFGRQSVLTSLATGSEEPLPFDLTRQVEVLRAEAASGIASPGVLDPDRAAAEANDIRTRVRGLRLGAFVLLITVAAFTAAQFASRREVWWAAAGLGVVLYGVATVTTFVTVW